MPTSRSELRQLATQVLYAEAGAVAVGRLCPACGSAEHGRPWVRDAAGATFPVSLSYADGLALVAWAARGRIGVDVATTGPAVGAYGDRESWTRREAVAKATGHDLEDTSLPQGVEVRPLPAPAGHVATLATLGVDLDADTVSWRWAGPAAPARPATR